MGAYVPGDFFPRDAGAAAIGQVVLFFKSATGNTASGDTLSGADLEYVQWPNSGSGVHPAGTWRNVDSRTATGGYSGVFYFQRIA